MESTRTRPMIVIAGAGYEARGASNAKAKRELGWRPAHPGWREGFAAVAARTGERVGGAQPARAGPALLPRRQRAAAPRTHDRARAPAPV
jgi:hypothetical protein